MGPRQHDEDNNKSTQLQQQHDKDGQYYGSDMM